MRRHGVIVIALLALLVGVSYAAQSWSLDKPGDNWAVFSSEDSGTSSYLGVDIADVTTDRLNALKLKEEKGVEVTMVDQDAPAGKAGLKEHDVILTMNGTSVESGAQLRRMIHETPPGRVVSLGLSRDGQPMTVRVQLADKHKEYALMGPKHPGDVHVEIPDIHIPDIDIPAINMVMATSSARSGLMVENITPQLGDFFGVRNGNGVLVRSVEKGSRAERAGFRAGDVVVKVNGEAVHDTSDFTHAVRGRKGNSVPVVVMRDKKEQTLTLSLPSRRESGDLMEEESFSEPLFRADRALQMSELQNEMAKLRPQMQLAAEQSRKAAEELRKDLCKQQKELRQQTAQQRKQLQKDLENLRRELLRMRDDWL